MLQKRRWSYGGDGLVRTTASSWETPWCCLVEYWLQRELVTVPSSVQEQASGQRRCRRSGGCAGSLQERWRGCFLERRCSCRGQKLQLRSRRVCLHNFCWPAVQIWWLERCLQTRVVKRELTGRALCNRWSSSTPPQCCAASRPSGLCTRSSLRQT